jgi:hypothetical protein
MLTTQNKQLNNIFERIIKDKNGLFIRVRFTIVEINGVFQGQIISAEPLVKPVEKTESIYLPCSLKNIVSIYFESTPSFISFISPFNFDLILVNQPTRAPSL